MNKNLKDNKFPKVIYITSISQCLYIIFQLFTTIYFGFLVSVDFTSYYYPAMKKYHLDGLDQSNVRVNLSILIIKSEQSFLGWQSLLETY